MLYKLFLCGFLFFFIGNIFAQTPIIYNGKDFPNINKNFTWYADSTGKLSINEIITLKKNNAFKTWTGGITFNRGISKSVYWLYIPVKNITNDVKEAVLKISSGIDSTWLYETDNLNTHSLIYKSSRYTPFNKRPFPYRLTAFPVQLKGRETKYLLLKADNGKRGIYFPLYMQSAQQILKEDLQKHWIYGVFFGVFLFIILYNIFLYASMKDNIHLWYAAYALSAIFFMIQDEKFYTELYPDSWLYFFENAWVPPFSLLMIATGFRVMQLFVVQEKKSSIWYWPVTIIILTCFIISFFMLALSFFNPISTIPTLKKLYFLTDIIVPISFVILIISLVEKIIQKKYLAVYYFIAVLLMVCGSLNFYLNHLGVTNFNLLKPNGVVVGLAFEIIILSFLLTLRYAKLKKDKEILIKNQQQQLAEAVIESQENERTRVARDLHDGVGSSLTGVRLMISNYFYKYTVYSSAEIEYRKKLLEALKIVSIEVRNISHNLMPKDIEISGLFPALDNLIYSLNRNQSSVDFSFIHHGEIHKIDARNEINILRIVNELVQNIMKHSEATKATLQCLLFNKTLQLMMEDNGKGFEDNQVKTGIGIRNIRSRVNYMQGNLTIDSGIMGTTFLIEIPLENL